MLPSLFPDGYVTNYNPILGKIRLKTVQVQNNTCSTRISLQDKIPFCYSDDLRVSKSTYGTTDQWTYLDDSQEYAFRSQFSNRNYPAGGFVVDIDASDFNATDSEIRKLREGEWIDLNTRAVVSSITLYNVNLNKIATVRVLFEFGLSGEAQSSAQVYQLNASFYTNTRGHGLLVIELICLLYIFFEFVLKEIYEVLLFFLTFF